jgi:hypothetical protein
MREVDHAGLDPAPHQRSGDHIFVSIHVLAGFSTHVSALPGGRSNHAYESLPSKSSFSALYHAFERPSHRDPGFLPRSRSPAHGNLVHIFIPVFGLSVFLRSAGPGQRLGREGDYKCTVLTCSQNGRILEHDGFLPGSGLALCLLAIIAIAPSMGARTRSISALPALDILPQPFHVVTPKFPMSAGWANAYGRSWR